MSRAPFPLPCLSCASTAETAIVAPRTTASANVVTNVVTNGDFRNIVPLQPRKLGLKTPATPPVNVKSIHQSARPESRVLWLLTTLRDRRQGANKEFSHT